jgi:hypothetical protein
MRAPYPAPAATNRVRIAGTWVRSWHEGPDLAPVGEADAVPGDAWPERVDTRLADGLTESDVDAWAQSASLLHSNGDAMDIAVKDGRIVGVRGRAVDRVNRGRLGPKDLYGWQANHHPDRLTRPLVRDDGRLVPTDWDTQPSRSAGCSSRPRCPSDPVTVDYGSIAPSLPPNPASPTKAGIGAFLDLAVVSEL